MVRNRKRRAKAEANRKGEKRHPCAGKKRHMDLEAATSAAVGLVSATRVVRAYVYICPRGPHYHVTTRRFGSWVRKVEQEGAP